ncbi:MAG: DNA repair protein RecN [Actinomycetia bacterium]|nr:DNA repair protein RecN [Actinomycetes bacterium]
MLLELCITDLGVISEVSLLLEPGMTALTGETGAGKTMVVEAIDLLVGGRADSGIVRPGADEARVEGRLVDNDGTEMVLTRVIPRQGRSRAYLDGRPTIAATLAEIGHRLIDLHGQHDHQSLLAAAVQRESLDRFGDIDLDPYRQARDRVVEVEAALAVLGGDDRERAQAIDLHRFQVDELDRAGLVDPDEDAALEVEEDLLADGVAHQEAVEGTRVVLADDGGMADRLAEAIGLLADRAPFSATHDRLVGLQAELDDLIHDLRSTSEGIEPDPQRLDQVRERRRLIHELQRKYGDTLAEVMEFADRTRARLAELESHDERAARLDADLVEARDALLVEAGRLRKARQAVAPDLAAAAQAHLPELAMPHAQLEIDIDGPAGDEVTFLFAANPGSAPAPLSKVASGGELARTMLALRRVLNQGPPILVFDEVDAGIGGEAAHTVGRALSGVAAAHQVLVVTHLPQVAAFADAHVVVVKESDGESTTSTAVRLAESDRVTELSRMLSGSPDSTVARDHAEELLATAATERSS